MSRPVESAVSVVLVHGGFVDGSGWQDVYRILKEDGFDVTIVQNPTTSLAADVAATKLALSTQKSPVILVGHSYGGVVITEAGNDPKVEALVYVAAFAPDKGESVNALIKDPPPSTPVRRFCRHGTVSCFWTRPSLPPALLLTSTTRKRSSWPTHKCRGALRL